jgi:cytochrome oxidase Cu insertion factor (SCO1/SenC/PrrC family)
MASKAVLVLVVVLSLSATAAITLTVLTFGPIAGPGHEIDPAVFGIQPDKSPAGGLPMYGRMPPFTLTDQDGKAFGLDDLAGNVFIVDTIFTRCTAICPTLTGGMKQIQSAIRTDPRYDGVRLVSISVDGGHDTPDVLKQYAQAYQADPGRWYFLTGERGVVWPLINNGLHLAVDEATPGDEMAISHTGKLVLIDRAGEIRGYYDGLNELGRIELLADLSRLLDQE